MNYTRKALEYGLEHQIDDLLVLVSSPVFIRRRKQHSPPIIKGIVELKSLSKETTEEFFELRGLCKLYPGFNLTEIPYKQTRRMFYLENKIKIVPKYCWEYGIQKKYKAETFNFIGKTGSDDQAISNRIDFLWDFGRNSWQILDKFERISILQRYKIFHKLLNEYLLIRLYE